MPYFMSKSKRCVLVHRLTVSYTISVIFFPFILSRGSWAVSEILQTTITGFVKMTSGFLNLKTYWFLLPIWLQVSVLPLDPSSQAPALVPSTYGHLLVALTGDRRQWGDVQGDVPTQCLAPLPDHALGNSKFLLKPVSWLSRKQFVLKRVACGAVGVRTHRSKGLTVGESEHKREGRMELRHAGCTQASMGAR